MSLTHLHTHRESAQCAEEDEKDFQNTDKHKYFNTNNLWIRLDKLKEVLDSNDGIVPLPMIKNSKTVEDPADDASHIYTHTCVCVCVSVCLHYMYICVYVYVYIFVCMYMYVCRYIYIYIYIYVYMYICIDR